MNNLSDKSQSSITGLGFRVDGQALQLFAVTPSSVSLFMLQTQPSRGQTLDQIGGNVNSVAMSDRGVCNSASSSLVYSHVYLAIFIYL